MLLEPGGADIWYIDESYDPQFVAVVGVSVPFLRNLDGQGWTFVWGDNLRAVQAFRKNLSRVHHIPARKELHAITLAAGRGQYLRGKHQFSRPAAAGVYRWICSQMSYLQGESIIAVVAKPGAKLYGHSRVEACLYALFQRIRRASVGARRNGLIFFDGFNPNYRTLYRMACRVLFTGSSMGAWPGGARSANLPLDMFVEDGNFKDSKHDYFIQTADLAAYALLMKIRGENGALLPWHLAGSLDTLYDAIPVASLNTRASKADPLGIVRL